MPLMMRTRLSGKGGAALDPCAAMQVTSIWPPAKSARSSQLGLGETLTMPELGKAAFEDLYRRARRALKRCVAALDPHLGAVKW